MKNPTRILTVTTVLLAGTMAAFWSSGLHHGASDVQADDQPTLNVPADHTALGPFFAFDNGVGRGKLTASQQARILSELGYQGIGYTGVENIPTAIQAFDAQGLKMYSTYLALNLDDDQVAYDPGLSQAIPYFQKHGTALWLHVHSDQPTSPATDKQAVIRIREIADMAAPAGLDVVLYPHTGFYVATTQDAVRLVKQVKRQNVGASFNLCHFLKQNEDTSWQQTLRAALPYLRLVSINGADSGDTRQMGWDRLIQTLDQGSFDVLPVLQFLRQQGYRGPIGLQCYAIPGDVRDNLKRSMQAWKKMNRELAD